MKTDTARDASRPTIRPYDAVLDLDRCMEIWRRASETGHPFFGKDDLDRDQQVVREKYMPAADILVYEDAAGVRGFIALLGSFIGGLFVEPAFHGRGIGRALVLKAAADRGILDVEVYEANQGARAFYRRLGFREVSRRDLDDHGRPMPLIAMRLEQP